MSRPGQEAMEDAPLVSPTGWWELAFVVDERIARIAFRSKQGQLPQGVVDAMAQALEEQRSQRPGEELGLVLSPIEHTQPGLAVDLLASIRSVVEGGVEGEDDARQPMSLDDQEQWWELGTMGRAIDAQGGNTQVRVEFIWQVDDAPARIFAGSFGCTDTAGRGDQAKAFVDMLEAWGEAAGHWRGFWTATDPDFDPTRHRMLVDEAEDWRQEMPELLDYSLGEGAMGKLVEAVGRADLEAGLELSLEGASQDHKPGPRM